MPEVYFAFSDRPQSYNNRASKASYKAKLSNLFTRNFSKLYTNLGLPLSSNELQSEIIYVDGTRFLSQVIDVDNISKPLIDAMQGIIYYNDNQVVRRVATRLNTNSYNIAQINISDLPFEAFDVAYNAIIKGKDQLVILKVKTISLNSFGGKFFCEN